MKGGALAVEYEFEQKLAQSLKSFSVDKFNRLCEDILRKLEPVKIERFDFTNDAGRDIELTLPVLESLSGTDDAKVELWWIECKKRKKGNITQNDLSKNVLFVLGMNPPPPHLLLCMTTTDLTNTAKRAIRNIPLFKIRYLNGLDICQIALCSEYLMKKYFHLHIDKYLKVAEHYKRRSKQSTQVLINALRSFGDDTDFLNISVGQATEVHLTIKNLLPEVVRDIKGKLELPKGIEVFGGNFTIESLQPFEEVEIDLYATANSNTVREWDQNSINLISLNKTRSLNKRTDIKKVSIKQVVNLPFVGRSVEFNQIIDSLRKVPSTLLIEGLPGEGKTRLLDEIELDSVTSKRYFKRINRADLNSASSTLLAITRCLIPNLENWIKFKECNVLVSSYLDKLMSVEDGDFVRFIAGDHQPTKDELDRFIGYIQHLFPEYWIGKLIIVVDDAQQLSPTSTRVLTTVMKVLRDFTHFIVCYRDNEISQATRNLLLNFSETIIQLKPLENQDSYKAISECTAFSDRQIQLLTKRTYGNPFCIVESIRLLLESGYVSFDKDGVIVAKEENSALFADYKDLTLNNAEQYARWVAHRRYRRLLEKNPEKRILVRDIATLIAANGQPLPLSLIENTIKGNCVKILDELYDDQLIVICRNYFHHEHGIYLVHDRMMEAILESEKRKKISWVKTNARLAKALSESPIYSKNPDYAEKIATHFLLGGNIIKSIEFRLKYLKQCSRLKYHDEIIIIGRKCLEQIASIEKSDSSTKLFYSDDKAELLLQIGLSQYSQRRFNEMAEAFRECKKSGRVARGRRFLIDVVETSSRLVTHPQESVNIACLLEVQLKDLESESSNDNHAIDAKLHALNKLFTYYKQHLADYDKSLQINARAISICEKHGRKSMLIWELINRGTMILFKDEKHRSALEFPKATSFWYEALDHWTEVLIKAEESREAEHIIETNAAVGFMKMFLGFKKRNEGLVGESKDHLKWAKDLSEKYGHPYWTMKLYNHLGIYAALNTEFDCAEEEFKKGLIVAQKIGNYFTSWIIQQNLANIEYLRNNEEEMIFYWAEGLKLAMKHYFDSAESSLKNYQFRQFIRGIVIHSVKYPRLWHLFEGYSKLVARIESESWIKKFSNYIKSDSGIANLQSDIYCFDKCYYNTH